MKTFWGWRDRQLRDGTIIWTLPGGHTYITTPGSALLFPTLCPPTGELPAPQADPPADRCGERTARMPLRTRTRTQRRAARIATERNHNRMAREARQTLCGTYCPATGDAAGDGEPPPF